MRDFGTVSLSKTNMVNQRSENHPGDAVGKGRTAGVSGGVEKPGDATTRILSVCETAQGGVGRYQDLLESLVPFGFSLSVLLPESDKGILRDATRAITFARNRRGPVAMWNLVRAFWRQKRLLRPELYFFHSTFSLLPLTLLRLSGDRTPAVYCAHCWAANTLQTDGWKSRIIRFVEGNLCGLADLVVNVSASDADTAQRFAYRGRHVIVENAVDPPEPEARADRFETPGSSRVNLLFVGRFDHQKGLDLLLPAYDLARSSNSDLRLHIVGAPVRGSELPVFGEGVTYHGWVGPGEIDSYYRSADALVVPSRWEGLPLVVPEAYRNGTPVIVARRSGMHELVDEGRTGWSFPLEIEALADLLSRVGREDLAKMRPLAEETYRERFSRGRFAEEMAENLRALLGGKRAG
ncbi:glycosyltransferase family 4 protein [Ruegeria aquimaris]|uniref:Glycosyltransferase family 4 protein n=1 Tax=Ruegeria aquimaris TaxID=2984333 RepID=A0ABT3ADV9_9RHOB|nr:glycosyltransferase family 4 protein [Ruegeria sp. XHP0148]MCV2886856.1 glycosyltransferase family 4 protein [Ruegeria sp. XHP0148]